MKNVLKKLSAIFAILSGLASIGLSIFVMLNYPNSDTDLLLNRILLIVIGVVIIITGIMALISKKESYFLLLILICSYYRFREIINTIAVTTADNIMVAILGLIAAIALLYSLFNFKFKMVARFISTILMALLYLFMLINFITNSMDNYVTSVRIFYLAFFILMTITYAVISVKYYFEIRYGTDKEIKEENNEKV